MKKRTIFTRQGCGYCLMAKKLLRENGLDYFEISLDDKPELSNKIRQLTGATSVPQIFFDEEHIGGYSQLAQLEQQNKLSAV